MWSITVFDSFNSSFNTYSFDEPLPIRLSYNQMFLLLSHGELVVETSVDGCPCHYNFRLQFVDAK